MKNKVLKIVIRVILIVFACLGVTIIILSIDQKSKMANLVFEEIDMTNVSDGTFIGESETGIVKVKLEVTVQNNQITDINIITHDNGLGSKAEKIIDKVIAENSYDVDAISGATVSSENIKSAISKALMLGME
ncbi:MAG: FMN-binding domain [Clostridiales bacterium]|jgi:uncharacterized protein with FMN-binding domain|nr:FMN-binding domain [Clostridiales bacterium]